MEKEGLKTEIHNISLLEVIIAIMVFPISDSETYYEILDDVKEIYNECLNEAENYPISLHGEELEGLTRKI